MLLKSVILDDDDMAIAGLEQIINKSKLVKNMKSFSDPEETINYLNENNDIDVLFLDVEMPSISGIDFLKLYNPKQQVVIISAFKNYAIDAFEYNVTDFLTKPIKYDRFLKSIVKVEENNSSRLKKNKSVSGDLFVKKGNKLVSVAEKDIVFIEALSDYATIHCVNNEKYVILSTMKSIENNLSNDMFFRIHRSFIVNLSKIKEIGEDTLLVDQHSLPISRLQKPALLKKLHLL